MSVTSSNAETSFMTTNLRADPRWRTFWRWLRKRFQGWQQARARRRVKVPQYDHSLPAIWDNPWDAAINGDADWLEQLAHWEKYRGVDKKLRLEILDCAMVASEHGELWHQRHQCHVRPDAEEA